MIDIPDSIFPTNDEGQAVCGKCQKPVKECKCVSYDPSAPKLERYSVRIRRDSKNRRGKTVTLIEGLPNDDQFCKRLAKTLKSKSGSGGSYSLVDGMGVIEIQGENVDLIKSILMKEGFTDIKQLR